MRAISSIFIACSNENKYSLLALTRTRVAWELTSESLHESFHQLLLLDQTRRRFVWELTSESLQLYMIVWSTFIAGSNENKSCMRVDKRGFTTLHESFINFDCLIKREQQELHESWQARVHMRVSLFHNLSLWAASRSLREIKKLVALTRNKIRPTKTSIVDKTSNNAQYSFPL